MLRLLNMCSDFHFPFLRRHSAAESTDAVFRSLLKMIHFQSCKVRIVAVARQIQMRADVNVWLFPAPSSVYFCILV